VIPLKDNIPTGRTAWLTIALILANVVAYLLAIRNGGSLWSGPPADVSVHYGAIPYELTHPGSHCELVQSQDLNKFIACSGRSGFPAAVSSQPATWLTALTAMFMHGSLLHLAGNMLFLWIFGNNIEDAMGRVRFIAFYVLGGLAALAGQVLIDPSSTVPTIGASGAIAAVLGGYALLYPRARVVTLVLIIFFVTIVELPALIVLGLWFGLQVLYAQAQLGGVAGGGGVAYFAHIGGFLFGLLAIKVFTAGRKQVPPTQPVYWG
jgi:membrane associated rhomboid family serine protease